MNYNTVLEAFCLMADLTPEKAEEFSNVVEISTDYIERSLKENIDISDKRLVLLAGALCNLKYNEILSSREEMRISENGKIRSKALDNEIIVNARSLYNGLREMCSDLLIGEGFVFEGIQ